MKTRRALALVGLALFVRDPDDMHAALDFG
jgi:hypothetical protein